ncbi:hypothetical protein F5J12DRAFT_779833 [Pisolithus orientalis]|uniref:uncharacterized protein n=1 Tax=Pisolithus orientalis TaxID=936130 RepID=UPI0022258F73|nr:uncharacterized protein F5J12DRAFT_779833 [Pisolithus orientalis]KAI6030769.1 hypothetical protein F5J12DRAFT_779833 [Pisolithus orientalis]
MQLGEAALLDGYQSYIVPVPEDAEEEGKLGYTTLKLLSDIMQHLKTGYIHMLCHDQIMRNTTPANAHAQHSHTEGEKVLKALGLWPIDNVFWLICNSDLYGALSFDCLHFLHGGLWGKHILQDILRILNILGCNAETNVENYVTFSDGNKMHDLAKAMFYALLNVFKRMATPEGYCLLHILASYLQLDSLIGLDMHTEQTIEMIDAELLKFDNKLKAYIECVNKSGLEGLQVDWDFPKVHLWKHVVCNIWTKGATRNYSTCPNESMHGPIKEAYECQSNGRDFIDQILHMDEHKLAAKLLRMCDDNYKNHVYLGSSSKPSTVQDIEASHSVSDTAFVFVTSASLNMAIKLITEYRYLKVNYKSSVDWKVITDHLRCNPSFYGQPQYDCTLIQLMETDTAFVHLISIFTCDVPGVGSISLTFVQLLTAKVGGTHQIDIDLWLICIKAAPCNNPIFIPIQSILHGAVVAPDPSHPAHNECFYSMQHVEMVQQSH